MVREWDDPIDDHDLVVADPQKHMSITTSYGPSELLPLRGFRNRSASAHQSFELATPAALFLVLPIVLSPVLLRYALLESVRKLK